MVKYFIERKVENDTKKIRNSSILAQIPGYRGAKQLFLIIEELRRLTVASLATKIHFDQ